MFDYTINISDVFIGLIAIAIPFIYSLIMSKREKKRLVVDLYEKYHSIEFYGKIRAPFYTIGIKWFYIENEQQREKYRKCVVQGWVDYTDADKQELQSYSQENCYTGHHVKPIFFNGLTEHQLLTIGLEFWSTLNILRKRKLVDSKTLRIFKDKYRYDKKFINDLRNEIVKAFKNKKEIPAWIENTIDLEDFFDFAANESELD